MATGIDGEKAITTQPTSPITTTAPNTVTAPITTTAPQKSEYEKMFLTFQAMGLNPKGDTPEELDKWIQNYIYSKDTKPIQPIHSLTLPNTTPAAIPKKTVTSTLSPYPPKIRSFSGGDNKAEVSYDVWRYEVNITLKDPTYTREQKDFAIRRSLTGSAARMIIYQGLEKPIENLLETLDSVYGGVQSKEQLLAEFYGARQKEEEDITAWSARLEDILGKGLEKGIIKHTEMNTMLHSMLWTGLRQELKDITGYKYDTIKDYNKLRIALRQIEKDHIPNRSSKPNIVKSATAANMSSELEELKGMVQQLSHKISSSQQPQFSQTYRGGYKNNRGKSKDWYTGPRQQRNFNSSPEDNNQIQQQQATPSENKGEIICHRCRQPGHIAIGCRVKLDHSRVNLNSKKPIQRGRY